MSLKTYINNEIQAFRKVATQSMPFGLQLAPDNKMLGIHDAYSDTVIDNPVSIDLIKIEAIGTFDSLNNIYNYKEIERISLPLASIQHDGLTEQYLVDTEIDYGFNADECIYYIEFANGGNTFRTEAFKVDSSVSIVGIDPEVEAWKIRVLANSGTVTDETLNDVDSFVKGIKLAGLRSYFLRLNLFIGGNLGACLTPLFLNTTGSLSVFVGNTYDTNIAFIEADYSESGVNGGLRADGTSKYLLTGINPSTTAEIGLDSSGTLVYNRTPSPTLYGYLVGAVALTPSTSGLGVQYSTSGYAATNMDNNAGGIIDTIPGIVLNRRVSSTEKRTYFNEVQTAAGLITSIAKPNSEINVFARGLDAANGNFKTDALMNCYGVVEGITDDAESILIQNKLNNFYANFERDEY